MGQHAIRLFMWGYQPHYRISLELLAKEILKLVGADTRRLAIIVSDDHTVDLIPLLPPQIARTDVETNIAALEKATLDNYHKPRNWLENHRFSVTIQLTRQAEDRVLGLERRG